jgi:ABC-type sugar transport system ATPase subunit
MAGLTIKNLTKIFDNKKVIDNISFDVMEGEFCILLGPSGCGKSTILRLIAGLEQQDSGKIFIGDRDVSSLTPKERDIAMVFQSYALYPHLNVYENMAFPLKIKKSPKHEIDRKVKEAARLLNIDELLNRKPKELSGGQRQRVAIGRAIVRSPKLFLFDEPLSNLDAKLRSTMRIEIARLHQQLKTTIIYVTHDQIEAMTLGQKIILIDNGAIQQAGTPREVYEKPANLFAASFIGIPPMNMIEGKLIGDEKGLYFKSDEFTVNIEPRKDLRQFTGKEVTAGIRPESMSPGEGPVSGHLEHMEHIGADVILYLKVNNTRITVRASYDFEIKIGQRLSLTFNPSDIHLFHNGIRIN